MIEHPKRRASSGFRSGSVCPANNLFNPISISDYAAFSKQQKIVMEDKVIDGGLLEEARKKAGEVISQLLTTANPEYTIQVQEAKAA